MFFANILSFSNLCLQRVPKRLGQGQQKTKKVEECSKNTCLERSTAEKGNGKQVGVMIGSKKSIPERLSCSQSKNGAKFTIL